MSYIKNHPATTVAPIVPAIIPSAASRFIMSSPPSEIGASMPEEPIRFCERLAPRLVPGAEKPRAAACRWERICSRSVSS